MCRWVQNYPPGIFHKTCVMERNGREELYSTQTIAFFQVSTEKRVQFFLLSSSITHELCYLFVVLTVVSVVHQTRKFYKILLDWLGNINLYVTFTTYVKALCVTKFLFMFTFVRCYTKNPMLFIVNSSSNDPFSVIWMLRHHTKMMHFFSTLGLILFFSTIHGFCKNVILRHIL